MMTRERAMIAPGDVDAAIRRSRRLKAAAAASHLITPVVFVVAGLAFGFWSPLLGALSVLQVGTFLFERLIWNRR